MIRNIDYKEEVERLTEELRSFRVKYEERGAAMRDTGDMVRSLYVGSEVSKRILAQRQRIEELEKENAELSRLVRSYTS